MTGQSELLCGRETQSPQLSPESGVSPSGPSKGADPRRWETSVGTGAVTQAVSPDLGAVSAETSTSTWGP